MKCIITLSISAFIFLSIIACSKDEDSSNSGGSGNNSWVKLFGGEAEDRFHDVFIDSEGFIVACGDYYTLDDTWRPKFFVVKMDKEGNVIWEKIIGNSGNANAHAIDQLSTGEYIVISDYALKIDSETGEAISLSDPPGEYYDVLALEDGGFIAIGEKLTRFSGDLSEVWRKNYGGSSIDKAIGGGFVIFGINGADDAFVSKISETGDVLWNKTYSAYNALGGFNSNQRVQIKKIGEEGYIFACSARPNFETRWEMYWLTKIDANGNVAWNNYYGGSFLDRCNTFDVLSDGTIMVGGHTDSVDGNITSLSTSAEAHAWFIHLNNDGSVIKDYSFDGNDDDKIWRLVVDDSNKVIAVGETQSDEGDFATNSGGEDAWILGFEL